MKYIVSLALVLFSFVFVEAHSVPVAKSDCTVASPNADYDYSKMANEILSYINDYRRKKGLGELTMNSVISTEAQQHSDDMARHKTGFGHSGFDTRMKHIVSQLSNVRGTAENVAFGSTSAREAVDNWLKSPLHKQNIEGPYALTGIGIAADNKGNLYFTQIFVGK